MTPPSAPPGPISPPRVVAAAILTAVASAAMAVGAALLVAILLGPLRDMVDPSPGALTFAITATLAFLATLVRGRDFGLAFGVVFGGLIIPLGELVVLQATQSLAWPLSVDGVAAVACTAAVAFPLAVRLQHLFGQFQPR